MGSGLGTLKSRIYEIFDVGSLESIAEQIADGTMNDMDDLVRHFSNEFDLSPPDATEAERVKVSFRRAADGWTDSVREQIASFACWSRKIGLMEQGGDRAYLKLPALLKRIVSTLEGRIVVENEADILLGRMNRAGVAIWEWFGNLEDSGIEYVGELVGLKEEEAFAKYYPEDYRDVEPIVRATVTMVMRREGIHFDYWKSEGRSYSPAAPLDNKPD